jgi:uncharacterized protein YcgI (DUF1989 family)
MANAAKLVAEFVIPKKSARAFEVGKSNILRVIAVEGPQVADFNAYNLHDLREHFSASRTRSVSGFYVREGTKLYSNPGRERVMMTVIRDPIGVHDILAARCSTFIGKYSNGIEGYKGCQELLAEVIAAYGLTPDDTHDSFNIFMHRKFKDEKLVTLPPLVKAGDSIDLLAEMDLLVAMTACPSEKTPTNDHVAKSIGIQILKHE